MVVSEGSCSGFYLFNVAEVVVFRAHSYGEDGVEEVVELLLPARWFVVLN